MKIYIGILSITLCILQVSGVKPKHGKHHGSPSENDIYATVSPRHGRGGGHGHGYGHHHHGGPPENPNDIIYADLQHGPPDQGPIYENVGGRGGHHHHHHQSPGENDPETLYSPVAGPGRGGCHRGGGGGYGGGGYGNDIDDGEPTHDYLPFQRSGGGPGRGPPQLPPRPPGGHPDPHSHTHHHPGHNSGNGICRRGGFRR